MNANNVTLVEVGSNDTDATLPNELTAQMLWRILPPILMVVGTIGNILSIIVLTRKTMRKSSVAIYLICLALADLLVLYTGLLRQWILYTFDTDVRAQNPFLCKVNTWLVYFSLDLSAWLLVSVTMERVISVWLPYKVKVICTKKVLCANILALTLVLMTVNGHFLFGMGRLEFGGEVDPCANLSRSYAHFLDFIFPWIDLCLFCLGPFAFHIVGNILIISRLVAGVKTMTQYNMATAEQTAARQKQMSSMTTMLLSTNLVYLVCTLPISIYLVYTIYWEQDMSPEARAKRTLVYACVNLLMYVNNCTNFITYILSGRRFRTELFRLFCPRMWIGRGGSLTQSSTFSNGSRSRQHTSTTRHASTKSATSATSVTTIT